jgi:hypothetical protein
MFSDWQGEALYLCDADVIRQQCMRIADLSLDKTILQDVLSKKL